MKLTIDGVKMIQKFEGCKLTAYWDVNAYSIGYGHHGADVTKDMKITKDEAFFYLCMDLINFCSAVDKYDRLYKFTVNEYNALVDFAYNCGVDNLKNLTKSGTRSKTEIAEKILLYNKAGGKELKALTERRQAERDLFLKG